MKTIIIKGDFGHTLVEEQLRSLEWPEHLGATEKLEELWVIENKPIEELCFDRANGRSVDPSDKVFKVLAVTVELKQGEGGKDNACRRKSKSMRTRGWGLKFNVKDAKLGQGGQAGCHCFRWNVTGMGYPGKLDLDKIMARRKKFW
jgi:hypothetical protein